MKYPPNVWSQLKGLNKGRMIKALLKDNFELDEVVRTERLYKHSDGRRISIHYHTANEAFGPKLLKALLEDTAWSLNDLRRLKLVK